jgi:GMP synthase (glutamine-hydrolysing)
MRHVACETIGTIADALRDRDIGCREACTHDGDAVPVEIGDASGLIVMGGPMGVYDTDRYPFLRDETRLIEDAVKRDVPVLGICLGSQLLASVLGAAVTPGEKKEIGWYPVHLAQTAADDGLLGGTAPSFTAFHWHGDMFDLPWGAIPLASSDLTELQAFRFGTRAYGILFHMEVTDASVRGMVETFEEELAEEGLAGPNILQTAQEHLPGLRAIGSAVFGRWSDLVVNRRG